MKRLLALVMLLIPGPALAAPMVSGVNLTMESDGAHLELALTAATALHVFYLDNPYRIVIDLQGTDWQATVPAIPAGAFVTGLRHGRQKSGAARLVIDLATPARIATADYLETTTVAKVALVVDLRRVSAASFRQAMTQPAKAEAWVASSNATPSPEAAIQTAAGATASTASATSSKKPPREPLLTSAYDELIQREQEASRDSKLGITSPDGYFITYMHPPGSLLGAGVTVGTQF
jgi:hypothetical protein